MPAPVERIEHLGTLADGRCVVRLLCAAQPVADARAELDSASKWIQIVPFGPLVATRDNRMFQVGDLARVAAASELPVLLDWEHKSEWGVETRAAGWFEEFAVENGAEPVRFPSAGLWGRVDLTDEGAKDVGSKAYRYVSPVLILDGETREVLSVVSVALTNRPALHMAEIGAYREQLSARFGRFREGEQKMDPKNRKLLLAALALTAEATDEQIIAAVSARPPDNGDREALSRQNAELTTQVAALNTQVTTQAGEIVVLKASLAKKTEEAEKAAFAVEVNAMLDANVKKIPPAARAGYEAFCMEGRPQFESFQKHVLPNLPEIGNPAPRSAPKTGSTDPAPVTTALTPAVIESLKSRGYTDAQIQEAQQYRAKQRAQVGLVEEED